MYEKLEHCPKCNKDEFWNYDAQQCNRCNFTRIKTFDEVLSVEISSDSVEPNIRDMVFIMKNGKRYSCKAFLLSEN